MANTSVTAHIAAPPEAVYDLVADLPRMGEWSPECTSVAWRGGATAAAPGVRFRGRNRNGVRRWSTTCTVVAAERGKELAWDVKAPGGFPVARWRYTFAPSPDGGCEVTESTEDRRGWFMKTFAGAATGVSDREARNRQSMAATLAALKQAAEAANSA